MCYQTKFQNPILSCETVTPNSPVHSCVKWQDGVHTDFYENSCMMPIQRLLGWDRVPINSDQSKTEGSNAEKYEKYKQM